MCSAYRNADGKYVVVVINYSAENKSFNFGLSGGNVSSWKIYRTSDVEGEDLKPVCKFDDILTPRSVTTFVSE